MNIPCYNFSTFSILQVKYLLVVTVSTQLEYGWGLQGYWKCVLTLKIREMMTWRGLGAWIQVCVKDTSMKEFPEYLVLHYFSLFSLSFFENMNKFSL